MRRSSGQQGQIGPYELLALLGLALILLGFNYSVYTKEKILATGTPIKLALAPRDPRALMTGDFMALNLDVATKVRQYESKRRDGFVIIKPDANGVAQFVRIEERAESLKPGELAIKFRDRERSVRVGLDAFYFQEGLAKEYEAARFGEYRLAANGDILLVQMLDEKLQVIKPLTPTQ